MNITSVSRYASTLGNRLAYNRSVLRSTTLVTRPQASRIVLCNRSFASDNKSDDFNLDDLISSLSIKPATKPGSNVDIADIFQDPQSRKAEVDPLQSMIDLLKEEEPEAPPVVVEEMDDIPESENYTAQIPTERNPVKMPGIKTLDKKRFLDMIKEEKKISDERKNIPVYKAMHELRYMRMYPKEILNWIEDLKTPIGYYDNGDYNREALLDLDRSAQYAARERGSTISSIEEKLELDQGRRNAQLTVAEPGWQALSHEIHHTPLDAYDPNEAETFWEELPVAFRGAYRYGVTAEDLKLAPNKVKVALSYRDATPREKRRFLVRKAMRQYQKNDTDTGAPGAMTMAVHQRVESLERHMSQNPTDFTSRHHYMRLVSHRHKLIKYFRRADPANYFLFLRATGMKDVALVK